VLGAAVLCAMLPSVLSNVRAGIGLKNGYGLGSNKPGALVALPNRPPVLLDGC